MEKLVTTKATAKEWDEYFSTVVTTVQERCFNKIRYNWHKLMRFIKQSDTKCICCKSLACHMYLPKNDIRVSCIPFGISLKHVNTLTCYLLLKDLHTLKPVAVRCVTNTKLNFSMTFLYETHALSRYRERFLCDVNMDFKEVVDNLMYRNVDDRIVYSGNMYGTDEKRKTVLLRCRDGVFTGYRDDSEVWHLTTFLTYDMAEKRQDLSWLSQPKELAKIIDEEYNVRYNPHFAEQDKVRCSLGEYNLETAAIDQTNKGSIHRLTEEEKSLWKKQVALITEFEEKYPEEYKKRHMQWVKECAKENKERYKNKMKRKGYK